MSVKPEIRDISAQTHKLELRAEAVKESDKLILRGYAALFNDPTEIDGYYIEQIAPGAFGPSIKDFDTRFLVNHDTTLILARKDNGTLQLKEDSTGVYFEVELAGTSYGKDLYELVSRGDIYGMSIGMRKVVSDWFYDEDMPKRVISSAELVEVSACTFPAYDNTSVNKRSAEEVFKEAEELRQKQAGAGIEIMRLKLDLETA